jgi:hypothetical protein
VVSRDGPQDLRTGPGCDVTKPLIHRQRPFASGVCQDCDFAFYPELSARELQERARHHAVSRGHQVGVSISTAVVYDGRPAGHRPHRHVYLTVNVPEVRKGAPERLVCMRCDREKGSA